MEWYIRYQYFYGTESSTSTENLTLAIRIMLAMAAFVQFSAWRNGRMVGRYGNAFPRSTFCAVQGSPLDWHWKSGSRDTMVAINWTATARCRCTFPRNTFIAIWRTPSERHRKSDPSSILNVGRSRICMQYRLNWSEMATLIAGLRQEYTNIFPGCFLNFKWVVPLESDWKSGPSDIDNVARCKEL